MSYLQQKLSSQPFEALKSLFRRSVENCKARSWSNCPQTGSFWAVTSLNYAQVSLLISLFPVFLIFLLQSPGSLSLNCFNILCSFFKTVWILVLPTWNTLASSLAPQCFLFMLYNLYFFKLRFFFFAPTWKHSVQTRLKMNLNLKQIKNVSELKLFTLICLIHFMLGHVHYI